MLLHVPILSAKICTYNSDVLVDGEVARVGLGLVQNRGDDFLHAQDNAVLAGHPDRGASYCIR